MTDDKIRLGPEVWQRVFNWRIYRSAASLFKEIFNRSFMFSPLLGLSQEEYERIPGLPKFSPISFLPFCKLIWETAEGRRRCHEYAQECVERIVKTKKMDVNLCHAGLTEVAIPIIYQGEVCEVVTTADGLLLHEPNEAHWQEVIERVKDIGVDLEALRKVYFQITPISKEHFEIMLKLIGVIIEEVIQAAVETEDDKKRIAELENALTEKYNFDRIIGKGPAMQDIFRLLRRIIETDSPVLIEGETGTGKELVANTIHYNSLRKDKPFMPINCGGLTETLLESELFGHIKGSFTGAIRDKKGLFEVADKGTVFLDEIAEMAPALQVKLLRVLQEGTFLPVGATETRKVDVRIISATNKTLKQLVNQGKFREDLYYRINVIKVLLPPLRERKEDLPLLMNYFLKTNPDAIKKKITGIRQDVLKSLLDYHWPGNIRELQNVLERTISLARSKYITPEDLSEELIKKEKGSIPAGIDTGEPYKSAINKAQEEYLSKILHETNGNVTRAARRSGISCTAFRNLLHKHQLNPDNFRD